MLMMARSLLMLALIISPFNAMAGQPILQDSFDRSEKDDSKEQIGKGWSTNSKSRAKGDKQVDLVDGHMHVFLSPQADHAVVVKNGIESKDCRIELKFRLKPKQNFAVNFSDRTLKTVHAGHLCGVRIHHDKLTIEDHKFGRFELTRYTKWKAGQDKEKIKEELKVYAKSAPHKLTADQWHKLTIVISGDTLTAQVDENEPLEFTSPGFGHPHKETFSLSVPKEADFDDVTVWQGAEVSSL